MDGCTRTYKDLFTKMFLVHVVGSRTTVMRASHDRHCTSLLSKQLAFAHALASNGTLHNVDYVNYLGYIQHTPLAVRQCEHDTFTDILRKLVRMRQQCIPGLFFSSPSKRPGNEANSHGALSSTYSNIYIIGELYTCWGSVYKSHNNKQLALVMLCTKWRTNPWRTNPRLKNPWWTNSSPKNPRVTNKIPWRMAWHT